VSSLVAEKRPTYVKHLECTTAPLKLIVEVEPKDKELKDHATKIKDGWGSIKKAVIDWQNALRRSGFLRPQALELLIEKPEEPKGTASVSVLQEQLAELAEKVDRVVDRLAELEADRAKKSSAEEAKAQFQLYTEGLKKFQELLASLQREIEVLINVDREFDTGPIIYVGRAQGGQLVDSVVVQATFVISLAN